MTHGLRHLAAGFGLFAGLLAAHAAHAAPTVAGLVSNIDQKNGFQLGTADYAQAFTTGGQAGGFALTAVQFHLRGDADASGYSVSIHPDSSGSPGASLGTLVSPASLPVTGSAVSFSAPGGGIDLDAGTTYWLVFDMSDTSGIDALRATASPWEDAGSAWDWSIGNGALSRGVSDRDWTDPTIRTDSVALAVYGHANNAEAPGAVSGLTAIPGDGRVTLSWTAGDDGGSAVTKHQYQQKEGSGSYGDWTNIDDSAPGEANATDFAVTGLTNGTAYTFRVRAVNAIGDGAESEEDAATPAPLLTEGPSLGSWFYNGSDVDLDAFFGRVAANDDFL